jgi:hypothetical protein
MIFFSSSNAEEKSRNAPKFSFSADTRVDGAHLLLLVSSILLPFPPHLPPSSSLVTSI